MMMMMIIIIMIEAEVKPTDTTEPKDEAGRAADTNDQVPESPPAETGSPTTTTDATTVSTDDSGTVSEAAAKPAPAPRVVIVTGASSGLGLAVSRMFCAGQHDVILACRSEDKATKAIAKIRKRQPDASATYMQVGELNSHSTGWANKTVHFNAP